MRFAALAAAPAAAALLAGCASAPPAVDGPAPQGPVASLKISSADYPPPGQCRIWHPGLPAETQPAAADCFALEGRVPLGAWVIHRPRNEDTLVEVTAYDDTTPKRVVWVRYFEMGSGRFVQELMAN